MANNNLAAQVVNEVKKSIVGKDNVLFKILAAILARGHILLEDIPGVGKTTLALAYAKALGLQFHRMQFTPDVMPSDVTGFSLYNKAAGKMEYQPGAVLCNLFLADELNRATSRTQSALLEAMEEGQVTVDGESHPVPDPFTVIATQNPVGASGTQRLPDSQLDRFLLRLSIGYPTPEEGQVTVDGESHPVPDPFTVIATQNPVGASGTQRLPDSQLDRFLLRLSIGYPTPEEELELLRRRQYGRGMDGTARVVEVEGLRDLRRQVDQVHVDDEILRYIVKLVNATRKHPQIIQGASPRAALAVMSVSRAAAFLRGRDYVVPDDVQSLWRDAVAHRLLLAPWAEETIGAADIADAALHGVEPPRIR